MEPAITKLPTFLLTGIGSPGFVRANQGSDRVNKGLTLCRLTVSSLPANCELAMADTS